MLDAKRVGYIDTDNIFLLRNGDDYNYVTYISLKGENSIGFLKQMFYHSVRPMQGKQKFQEAGLDLTAVTKGKGAWKQFAELMK